MTCGIYVLSFEGTDKVYIGKSNNVERRFKEHLYRLKNCTEETCDNIKLYSAYLTYGTPNITILENVSHEDLGVAEQTWINEFDSMHNGLNICAGGTGGFGCNAPNSKYSEENVIKVFELLCKKDKPTRKIAEETKVKVSTVQSILLGTTHTWLSEEYPEKYKEMRDTSKSRSVEFQSAGGLGYLYPTLIGPDGTEYKNIDNISEFARVHNIDRSVLSKVLNGTEKSISGYRLIDTNMHQHGNRKSTYPSIISPEGVVFRDITNATEFSRTYKLNRPSLTQLMNGKIKVYKGWRLYNGS